MRSSRRLTPIRVLKVFLHLGLRIEWHVERPKEGTINQSPTGQTHLNAMVACFILRKGRGQRLRPPANYFLLFVSWFDFNLRLAFFAFHEMFTPPVNEIRRSKSTRSRVWNSFASFIQTVPTRLYKEKLIFRWTKYFGLILLNLQMLAFFVNFFFFF